MKKKFLKLKVVVPRKTYFIDQKVVKAEVVLILHKSPKTILLSSLYFPPI